ncbi:MAG: DNA mismatch repair protein MutS [Oscillospiraceae bacterium]
MSLPENNARLSPMMRQYVEIKKQHMNELLFYRLGDFYELFFDDALTASRELELVLTGRDCGLPERAPMCGLPHHASESYIARLIEKGYRVAVCEQMEDPSLAKGIVKREIIRVVTPGTVTDTSMLVDSKNNYICCCRQEDDGFGLCFADISTGKVYVTESGKTVAALINELSRFEPSESILNEHAYNNKEILAYVSRNQKCKAELLYNAYFETENAKKHILDQFGESAVKALFAFSKGYAVTALGAMLRFLEETQLRGVERLAEIESYVCEEFLSISSTTRRNLELTSTMQSGERRGSFLWAIDRTTTSMGKRMMRSFLEKPLLDSKKIVGRLDSCEELYDNSVLLAQLSDSLKGVFDIERLLTRVVYRSCTPRDLNSLASTSKSLDQLKYIGKSCKTKLLKELYQRLDTLADLRELISKTLCDEPPALLKDGGFIRTGFDPDVDELRELVRNSKFYLAKLETKLKEKTGIKNLKIGYNRVFGYYIEVSRTNAENVPDNFIRKQTLSTGERYITEELKELETKILSSGDRLLSLERQIFEELCVKVEAQVSRIQQSAYCVAYIDVLCSFAELSRMNGYTKPEVNEGDEIKISGGRHPVVERVINDELFVPNDTLLDCGKNLINIITGPNMAGKSTYMRQTALIVLLAQMGCFVPALSAKIGIVDAIYTRVGASDDLFAGNSTFMVEMREVAEILNGATKKSLIILDEIGRGTSTFDGMSIARAVVEQICKSGGIGAKTMFATHYHELTDMEADFDNIKNYSIAVKKRGDDITFLRRIVSGPADESYGIEVAKLAGLPQEAVQRAKEILAGLESDGGSRLERRVVNIINESEGALSIALSKVKIDSLTPIEAMYTLNDLIKLAHNEKEQ